MRNSGSEGLFFTFAACALFVFFTIVLGIVTIMNGIIYLTILLCIYIVLQISHYVLYAIIDSCNKKEIDHNIKMFHFKHGDTGNDQNV